MWQATGRSDITDFEEVLALDLEYIDNWSLGLDMKILLKDSAVNDEQQDKCTVFAAGH